jgi:hypothetical protein
MDATPERQVFRSQLARVGSYVWFVIAALNAVDLLVRGNDRSAWVALAAVLLVTVVVYLVGFRPAVVVQTRGVLLRNPARDVVVPWPAVTAVDATDALRVHAGGETYRSWAVQVANRSRARSRRQADLTTPTGAEPSERVRSELAGRTHADYVAEQVRETWQRAADAPQVSGGAGARVRWHVPGLAALGASVVLLVVVLVGG